MDKVMNMVDGIWKATLKSLGLFGVVAKALQHMDQQNFEMVKEVADKKVKAGMNREKAFLEVMYDRGHLSHDEYKKVLASLK